MQKTSKCVSGVLKIIKSDKINLCKKGVIPRDLSGWYENLKSYKMIDRLREDSIDEISSSQSED